MNIQGSLYLSKNISIHGYIGYYVMKIRKFRRSDKVKVRIIKKILKFRVRLPGRIQTRWAPAPMSRTEIFLLYHRHRIIHMAHWQKLTFCGNFDNYYEIIMIICRTFYVQAMLKFGTRNASTPRCSQGVLLRISLSPSDTYQFANKDPLKVVEYPTPMWPDKRLEAA